MTLQTIWSTFTKIIDISLVWLMFYYILKNIKNNVKNSNVAPQNNLNGFNPVNISNNSENISNINPVDSQNLNLQNNQPIQSSNSTEILTTGSDGPTNPGFKSPF